MTFEEYKTYWTGRKTMDYDGAYGNQCVDNFRFYVRDVLGFPQPPGVKGAVDLSKNYDPKYFQWIPNTPGIVFQKGDIIIFDGTPSNPFGHVGIGDEADIKLPTFKSFDINFPSEGFKDAHGNFIGTGTAHIQTHKWSEKVLGWLRPIPQTPPVAIKTYTQAEWKIERDERNTNWQLYQDQLVTNKEVSGQLAETKRQLETEKDAHTKDIERVAVILDVRPDMAEILPAIETAITFEDKATKYQELFQDEQAKRAQDLITWEKRLGDLQRQLNDATKEIERLKAIPPISSTPDTVESLVERIKRFFLKN